MKHVNLPILLAEDSEDDVFFMERAFQEAGIQNALFRVSNGQQAMDYLAGTGPYADRVHFPFPCLVLLDLQLPLRTGIEVLQWVRSRADLQTLIVIVLTTSAQRRDVVAAYTLGARSFLVKPHTTHQLRKMLEALKVYWLDHNEFVAPEAPAPKDGAPSTISRRSGNS